MKESAKENQILSENYRGFLTSCLVLITAFVMLVNFTVDLSELCFILSMDGVYLLSLIGYVLLFTEKSKSQLLKAAVTIFSVVSVITILYLGFTVIYFINTFKS